MFRKRFAVLLSFLIITIIGSGYGVFIFEEGNSSSSTEANHRLDDIRDNYVFHDNFDSEILTVKRYNVYFMAQSDFDPIKYDSGKPILGDYNYHFDYEEYNNKLPDGEKKLDYTGKIDETGLDINLGYFGNQEDKVYYKVLKNVSEVSIDDLFNVIGEPTTNCTDKVPKGGTNHGWELYFNGWTLDYNVNNYSGLDFDNYNNRRVTGNFPHPGSQIGQGVRIMRFGTTIDQYLNSLAAGVKETVVHENGTAIPDIFVFPIYTSGKDYVSENNNNKNNPIRVRYGKENDFKDVFMNRGYTLNNRFKEDTNYVENVAVYNKYAVDLNGSDFLKFNYADIRDGWGWQHWYPIGKHTDTKLDNIENNAVNFIGGKNANGESNRLSRNGKGAGVYAIYGFRKEGAEFTGGELLKINAFCDNTLGMDRFYSFTSNLIKFSNVTEQIYFVFERFYEPRLLGGPTGSFDYNSQACKDFSFTRAINDSSLFALRNVKLTADTDMDWHNYNDYSISSAIFSIKLENVPGHISSKQVGNKDEFKDAFSGTGIANIEDYNIENYFEHVTETTNLTNYVKSSSNNIKTINDIVNNDLKEGVSNSFIVNKKLDNPAPDTTEKNIGFGVYNIALKVNYDTKNEVDTSKEFGPYIPSHVDVYVCRVTNIYTMIYDGVVPQEEILSNGFVKPDLNNSSPNHAFVAKNIFLDTNLEGGDMFIASSYFDNPNPSDELIKLKAAFKEITGEDITNKKNIKLSQIIQAFDKAGKELYDRVTGFVLTEESLKETKFKIEKNYIFQARPKTVKASSN